MINKKTFKPFRLEDITGGINTRDNPSEIEDKQAVSVKNWNFEGNKLITEKGYVDSGNAISVEIGALTIDSGDIWTVSAGDIKKNGVIVAGGVGILVTTSLQTFKPGVAFYITIEGVPYIITGNTVADFIFNLKTAVEANGLITVSQDDIILIKKADGSAITYSTSANKACVIYNMDNTSSYVFGKDYVFALEVNGVLYEGIYTPSADYLNAGQKDIELLTQLKGMLPSSLSVSDIVFLSNPDLLVIDYYQKNAGFIINNVGSIVQHRDEYYEYRINGYTSRVEGGYDGSVTSLTIDGNIIYGPYVYRVYDDGSIGNIDVQGAWNISINLEGNIFSYSTAGSYRRTMVSDLISSINAHGAYTAFQGTSLTPSYSIVIYKNNGLAMSSISVTDMTPDIYYSGSNRDIAHIFNGSLWVNNAGLIDLFKNRIINQLNAIPGITAVETTKDTVLGIYFRKNIYKQCTIVDTVIANDLDVTTIKMVGADIRQKTYEEVSAIVKPLSTGTGLNGRSNITIGNLGNLVVDKDIGGAYYSYDNLKVKIGEDAVGLPTVGTIYNGKIVLGGFEGNDNIIFSKTSSPTQPLNVLNFTDYSAGGQSVSGGDKGLITGMIVGENGLYVFKDNSIWYTNSEKDDSNSNSFNFIFRKITSNGALSQNVITEVSQEIFYLDWKTRDVRRLGYEQNLTTLRDVSISREISSLFEGLPEEQPLATSHFKYPNYQLSLTDGLSDTVEYNNGKTYHLNNKHFVYNVENKSWTTRDGIDTLIVSDKGYFALNDGKIYQDFKGWTSEEGEYISKLYTFGDDIMYKKYGRIELVGKIIPDSGETKSIIIDVVVDGETVDSRVFERDSESQIREKVDLYDIGQDIRFILRHEGKGKAEVHDIQIHYKGTPIQPQDFN